MGKMCCNQGPSNSLLYIDLSYKFEYCRNFYILYSTYAFYSQQMCKMSKTLLRLRLNKADTVISLVFYDRNYS